MATFKDDKVMFVSYHIGKCVKLKSTVAVNQDGDKKCPVCDNDVQKYNTKTGAEGISRQIRDCPRFKSANDNQKKEMLKKVLIKHPVFVK